MNSATLSSASATLSGRELALKRRQAMALNGKAALSRSQATAATPLASAANARASADAKPEPQAWLTTPLLNRSAGRLRREALSQHGKAAMADPARAPTGQGRPLRQPITAPAAQELGHGQASALSPVAVGLEQSSARAFARARRAAMAQDGKGALKRLVPAQTGRPATSSADSSGASRRPVGRVRPQVNPVASAPEKVEGGHALQGRALTASRAERSLKVTGSEHGAGRAVTGTEYIGAEQVDNLRERRSSPAPAKVAVSSTLGEQKVTGIEVGRSANVTGDELGACRGITGTEYLSAERYDEFCVSRPDPAPKKVEQTHTAAGKLVTGTRFGQSENVSGGEAGACRGITGTEYLSQEQFISTCATQAPVRPLKVSVMSSRGQQTVSGTEVGRSANVTGDEPGSRQHITGSQYYSAEGLDAQRAARVAAKAPTLCGCAGRGRPGPADCAPPKSIGDGGAGCLSVTGSYFEPTSKVTGNDFGGSAQISGSQYAGPRSMSHLGEQSSVMAQSEPVRPTAVISAATVTGDRPGAGAVSGRFLPRQSSVEATEPNPAPLAFSIQSPARVAHDQTLDQVTGSSFGIDRITGAANKAGGLITGTPEFRHQVPPRPLAAPAPSATPAGKVTGEGSQAGRAVTGDAWHATRRVTGTEGASSLMRNPSAKGTPRGMGVNAQVFRTIEKPAIPVQPESRITGSAGSSGKGASVTLSGGARG